MAACILYSQTYMAYKFIDYQTCEIEGEKLLFFKEPIQLLRQIEKRLSEIGAEKFYSSTDPDVKKDRESLAAFFFLLGLKTHTERDWFLMHPNDTFPDFYIMSASESDPPLIFEGVELVEIHPTRSSFEEAYNDVMAKLKKGYPPNYNLLVFINNEQSKKWVNLLNDRLKSSDPFRTIWTVHLLAEKDNSSLLGAVINRLRPYPIYHVPIKFSDTHLYYPKELPKFVKEKKVDGSTFLEFDKAFLMEFRKMVKRQKLD